MEGLLPEQHPARFLWQVLSSLDFSPLEGRYRSVSAGPGRPPYHPRVLAALWIYGMSQGLETAADVAMACRLRDDLRWLAGGLSPSDQTLLNFLTDSAPGLASIWEQVLKAMHQAGHIDLSVIAEDGTKLRANASPRSFLTANEIRGVIEGLKARLADKLQQLASGSEPGQDGKPQAEVRQLQRRLARAEHAARELDERLQRRGGRPTRSTGATAPSTASPELVSEKSPQLPVPRFTRQDFRHHPDRDTLICPAEHELSFIGEYPTDNGRGSYRLYGRSDCGDCPRKARCTVRKGRRVKVAANAEAEPQPPAPPATTLGQPALPTTEANEAGDTEDKHPGGPKASVTEPEAVMMLATSEKRWEPSYNADLAVTRHGIIVSQFLTKDPTDFHHFEPALGAVLSTVGKPDSWVGDGHYGTQANVLLADREGVFLYATSTRPSTHRDAKPPAAAVEEGSDSPSTAPGPSSERFGGRDFHYDAERGVMICPADQQLRLIGVYSTGNGLGSYRLFGRSDCRDCSLKSRCTDGRGRRVKMPVVAGDFAPSLKASGKSGAAEPGPDLGRLLEELADRMEEVGDAVLRFRGQTVEPVNAHLKQHGLGRFHVRGLSRCAAILTLGCIAHNLTKWKAREATRSLRAIAA